jgi:hypothetical protein
MWARPVEREREREKTRKKKTTEPTETFETRVNRGVSLPAPSFIGYD